MAKRIIQIFSIVLVAAVSCITVHAEEQADSVSFNLYFSENSSTYEPGYHYNNVNMAKLAVSIKSMLEDESYNVQDITIRSCASPKGGFMHNMALSDSRAKEIENLVQSKLSIPENLIIINSVGEDWETLYRAVLNNDYVPDREKIIEHLDNCHNYVFGSRTAQMRSPKKELMELSGGNTWFWLLDNIFPKITCTVTCHFTHTEVEKGIESQSKVNAEQEIEQDAAQTSEISEQNTVAGTQAATANRIKEADAKPEKVKAGEEKHDSKQAKTQKVKPEKVKTVKEKPEPEPQRAKKQNRIKSEPEIIPEPQKKKDIIKESESVQKTVEKKQETVKKSELRIGTNLIYDAATVANLSIEAGFCKHLALNLTGTYSPWDIKNDFKIRTLLFQPEFRYYIAPNFKGHYIGLEGHYGWYNVAMGGNYRWQDRDGNTPLWGCGLIYGYNWLISKHFGIDFTVGGGYTRMDYDRFYNIPNGARSNSKVKEGFGPTKAGISIYYQF